MDTVANLKEQAITQTPLLLFDVALAGGPEHHWCTHGVTAGSESYSARVLRHNLFEIQTASDYGIDAIPKIALTLANADSFFSQVEAATGFKGGKLKATFLFYDLVQDEPASESTVVPARFQAPSVSNRKSPMRRPHGAMTRPMALKSPRSACS